MGSNVADESGVMVRREVQEMRKAFIPKACEHCGGFDVKFQTVIVGEGLPGEHETVISMECGHCGVQKVMPCCGNWDYKPHSPNCPVRRQLEMDDLDEALY